MLPLLCDGGQYKDNFLNQISSPAKDFFRIIFDSIKPQSNQCGYLDMDGTIITESFPNIVLAKQIEEGAFAFNATDVNLVFGFEAKDLPGNPDECVEHSKILITVDRTQVQIDFNQVVKEIHDIFETKDRRLDKTFEATEVHDLRNLVALWFKVVFHVLSRKSDKCTYLMMTIPYRLLYKMDEQKSEKLMERAFNRAITDDGIDEYVYVGSASQKLQVSIKLQQKASAYPMMVSFIRALKEERLNLHIISASHEVYLRVLTKLLNLEIDIKNIHGTKPHDGDNFTNVLIGNGYVLGGENKANKIKELGCPSLIAAGDSKYDKEMLEESLKGGGYALIIGGHKTVDSLVKLTNTLDYAPRIHLQGVNGIQWK